MFSGSFSCVSPRWGALRLGSFWVRGPAMEGGGDLLYWCGVEAIFGRLPNGLERHFGRLPLMPVSPPLIALTPPLIGWRDWPFVARIVRCRYERRGTERLCACPPRINLPLDLDF